MKPIFEPGDLLLCKLAGINPRSILVEKGLQMLEEKLPHPWTSLYKEVRTLPLDIKDKVTSLFSSDTNETPPAETKKEETTVTPAEAEVIGKVIPEIIKSEVKVSSHEDPPREDNQKPINTDQDLVAAFKESAPEIQHRKLKDREGSRPEDYFTDDWDIPYGMSFTLMPPYIQI